MSYKYSKRELGKDGTVNPNYYEDGNPNSNKMLLYHIQQIFPPQQVIGFYSIVIYKYIKRFQGKNGVEDLKKAQTYLKFLIKYVTGLIDRKDN